MKASAGEAHESFGEQSPWNDVRYLVSASVDPLAFFAALSQSNCEQGMDRAKNTAHEQTRLTL